MEGLDVAKESISEQKKSVQKSPTVQCTASHETRQKTQWALIPGKEWRECRGGNIWGNNGWKNFKSEEMFLSSNSKTEKEHLSTKQKWDKQKHSYSITDQKVPVITHRGGCHQNIHCICNMQCYMSPCWMTGSGRAGSLPVYYILWIPAWHIIEWKNKSVEGIFIHMKLFLKSK